MPRDHRESVKRLCRRITLAYFARLAIAPPADIEAHIARIGEIVWLNLATGRAQKRMYGAQDRPLGAALLSQYVDVVVHFFFATHARWDRLHVGDTQTWTELHDALSRIARRYLDEEHAADCAQEAYERILAHDYPFDVSLEAWTGIILLNVIRHRGRSRDALDYPKPALSLEPADADDPPSVTHETIEDTAAMQDFLKFDNTDEALRLLSKLDNPLQRDVLTATYLEGLDDGQIAERLHISRANVQTIRSRALKQVKLSIAKLKDSGV